MAQLRWKGQRKANRTIGKHHPPRSMLHSLKSALFCSCGSKDDVVITHSDKRRAKDSPEEPQRETESTKPSAPPSDALVHLPTENQVEVLSIEAEPEDDDISVISLGEARRLAQLRIDGVGVSFSPISPCKITDSLSKPSSTSTVPQKRTLPPIEPVYRKKAMSMLKKALKKGRVSDIGGSSVSVNKKYSKEQKNEAKKEAKEKKEQQRESKKKQKLESWLDKKMSSTAKVATSLENLMAKEHAKIAELHKRISEVEQKRSAKQQQLSELKKMEGRESKHQTRKMARSLRAKERKLKKLRNEVDAEENKLKQLTSEQSTPGAINESGQAKADNRAVSETNAAVPSGSQGPPMITVTPEPRVIMVKSLPAQKESSQAKTNMNTAIASGSQGPSTITATPGPRVVTVKPLPTQSDPILPPRPSTAVKRFLLPPDRTTVTRREQLVRKLMKVEQRAQEEMFERPRAVERPRAAHPFRIRSRTENVQEFLPYELEDFEDDSEDEEPITRIEGVEAEGMKRFEQQQNARSQTSTERKWRVRWTTVVDTDSEDEDFEFHQLELTNGSDRPTPSRPLTRCTNGMAKQMLREEEMEGTCL